MTLAMDYDFWLSDAHEYRLSTNTPAYRGMPSAVTGLRFLRRVDHSCPAFFSSEALDKRITERLGTMRRGKQPSGYERRFRPGIAKLVEVADTTVFTSHPRRADYFCFAMCSRHYTRWRALMPRKWRLTSMPLALAARIAGQQAEGAFRHATAPCGIFIMILPLFNEEFIRLMIE